MFTQTETALVKRLKKISMLSAETLTKLRDAARLTSGTVLEIGAYIGGSTCAVGDVLRHRNRQLVSIECGGSYPDHPLPSHDILRDLHANLRAWDLGHVVTVIPKVLGDAFRDLPEVLRGKPKVDLLFIDADGNVGVHMFHVAPYLADRCVVVLDDYDEPTKGPGVRSYVAKAVATGSLECTTLEGGATWFGRLTGSARDLPALPFLPETGHCWLGFTPIDADYDDLEHGRRCPVELWEDDSVLGPAHLVHSAIRETGKGGFSFWRNMLYFSTSDNTNPNTNGRRYTARFGGHVVRLN